MFIIAIQTKRELKDPFIVPRIGLYIQVLSHHAD